MNKSKEEMIEDAKKYIPKQIVGLDGLRLMLLGFYLEKERKEETEKAYARREKEYARCEMAYKEYQKRVRLINQVTKEES